MKKRMLLLLLLHSLCLGACAAKDNAPHASYGKLSEVDHSWHALTLRLQKDGFDSNKLAQIFSRMGTPPSLRPMGTKVKELYTSKFLTKTTPAGNVQTPFPTALGIPGPWFKDVVTRSNAQLCREFIRSNSTAFKLALSKYGVPASIGVALLFVETHLGKHTGNENALYSLASMSTKFPVENIMGYVDGLPDVREHSVWIETRMEEKSDWAYKELKALLTYCDENGLDPHSIPGSVYGAIGICQFMPTNISRFAEDGNGDGIIDLFNAPDAILSLSRYLSLHGWRKGLTLDEQVKVLMRYNKMLKYAHTILALAKTIDNLGKPMPKKQTVAKKKAVKASAIKATKTTPRKAKSQAKPKGQKSWVTAKGRDITTIMD